MANTTVDLPTLGTLRGNQTPQGVHQFLNVPYALIPARWRAPAKLTANNAWPNGRDAQTFGPQCPQPPGSLVGAPYAGDPQAQPASDEFECLNLNVYTPERAGANNKNLVPVMVWIHGGSFRDGTANVSLYDPTNMIAYAVSISHPVVVVTVNYRLNVFGFLSSRELERNAREDPRVKEADSYAGNWGLLDQKMAFEWVKDYIKYFGGDPDRITAFGESAGAVSLHYHLLNPAHHGLFRRVIFQSGAASTVPAQLIAAHQPQFDALCAYFKIPPDGRVEALCQIPADQLAHAAGKLNMVFGPVVDGRVVLRDVKKMWREEEAWDPKVEAVMVGVTKDEGTLFTYKFGALNLPRVNNIISKLVPASFLPRFRVIYSTPTTDDDAKLLSDRIFGDMSFLSPCRSLVAHLSLTHPRTKVYYYHFHHALEATQYWGLGIHHAVELPFLFLRYEALTPEEQSCAERVVAAWVGFAWGDEARVNGVTIESFKERGEKKAMVFGADGTVKVEREEALEQNDIVKFWADVERENARVAEEAKAKL